MKKYLIHILWILLTVVVYTACIEDESTGWEKALSAITIRVPDGMDTIRADFGMELTIDPTAWVEQSLQGQALQYEWRASFVKYMGGQPQQDSLAYLSAEPTLRHAFKRLGEYWVRLRVSNEDGSSFHQFVVYVEAAFEEGLFILSEDEQGEGRTTFVRTSGEAAMLHAQRSDFIQRAFETVNPGYPLHTPTDAVKVGSEMYITSREDQALYRFDYRTFGLIHVVDLKQEMEWLKPVAFCAYDYASGASFMLLGDNGRVGVYDTKQGILYEDTKLFPPEEHYDDFFGYVQLTTGHFYFIDDAQSRIRYVYIVGTARAFSSNALFAGEKIVNLMCSADAELYVVSVNEQDPQRVTVTRFGAANYFMGAFMNPYRYSYTADRLTLERTARIAVNQTYKSAFYAQGGRLYFWPYTMEQPLPRESAFVAEFPGEITSMDFSSDNEYLWIGVWDRESTEPLKGSVYMLKVTDYSVVNSWKNVADRPVKLFYKKR